MQYRYFSKEQHNAHKQKMVELWLNNHMNTQTLEDYIGWKTV